MSKGKGKVKDKVRDDAGSVGAGENLAGATNDDNDDDDDDDDDLYTERETAKFSQIYIYDPHEQLGIRMGIY
ncbi:hypothetical protein BGZ58_001445, partial [Dissophora ornata]